LRTAVRTKTVKKSAKVIIERYYPKLTLDFETNKRICDEIAIIASKRLRNKVRGKSEAGAQYARGLAWEDADEGLNSDRWLHHPLDEAYPAWPRPRYLLQASGGGA
jgi:ribosomal protein S17E